MPRTQSTNRATGDKISATRLQQINAELDSLYQNWDDIGRVSFAQSWSPLKVDIGAFPYSVHGNYGIYAWTTDLVIADNSTKYILIDSSWVISVASATDSNKALLAIVVTASWDVVSITNYKASVFGGYVGTGDMNWPSGAVSNNLPLYDWATGKLLKDSLKSIQTTVNNVDTEIPTSLAMINFMRAFWDWSDWDVTISWTVTLTRDMYYNNLTIPISQILNPNWYKIYVKWILINNGIISRNGNVWWAGGGCWQGWSPIGWTWWSALHSWTLWTELWWGSGWANGGYGNGGDGWAGTSVSNSFSNVNWSIGWTGCTSTGTWWIWWVAGTSTRWPFYNKSYRPAWFFTFQFFQPITQYLPWASSGGGGGWAQYYTNGWWGNGGWWWAGGNGWTIFIAVWTFNNTGTITTTWWAGGGWWWASSPWWGGAGWQWWSVILVYHTLITLGTITTTWWAGGASGGWWATAGGAGNNGNIIQITI